MLPPTTIPLPTGTKSFYITALSLCPTPSTVSISWTMGSATFGATFVGPNPDIILGDKVFDAPIIVQDHVDNMPKEISVSFNFEDTMTTQHSVSEPVTKGCGPGGSASKVMVSGYKAGDEEKSQPTTVTIMFKKEMHGFKHH